jgi:hypothetical protein
MYVYHRYLHTIILIVLLSLGMSAMPGPTRFLSVMYIIHNLLKKISSYTRSDNSNSSLFLFAIRFLFYFNIIVKKNVKKDI